MNRRDAIERVALLVGGSVIGSQLFIAGCKSTPLQVNAMFNADQVAFLNEVGDTILPPTQTPGAKAADVGNFMAIMVMDCYSPADQKIFMSSFEKIDGESQQMFNKKFMDCDSRERNSLLNTLDKAQKKESKQPKPIDKYHYFAMVKQMTLLGYFTSEIGCTKALRYVPVPGHFDGNLPYRKGDKAWALA